MHALLALLHYTSALLLLTPDLVNIDQIGLLNVDGFYNCLLSFIDMAVREGFIKEDARRLVISAPTAKELMLKLEVILQHPNFYVGSIFFHHISPALIRAILLNLSVLSNHTLNICFSICRSMFRSTRSAWCGRIRARSHTASRRSWSPGSCRPDWDLEAFLSQANSK